MSICTLDCYNYDFGLVSSDKTVEGHFPLLSILYYSSVSFTRAVTICYTASFLKTARVLVANHGLATRNALL